MIWKVKKNKGLMNTKVYKLLIVLLFLTTLLPYFTGDSKGLLIPYGYAVLGLIDQVIRGYGGINEVLLAIWLIAMQSQLLLLLKFNGKRLIIILPSIFLTGFLVLNFYNLNFKDYEKAFISLLPFAIIWILLLIADKKGS